jgi:hypothetical protein
MVRIGFLRTQQRAKSQCIEHNLVNAPVVPLGVAWREVIFAMDCPVRLARGVLLV